MAKVEFHKALVAYRKKAGLSVADVSDRLVLGKGWLDAWESAKVEPPLGLLNELVSLYGSTLEAFFADVLLGKEALAAERHLVTEVVGRNLELTFPMGSYAAKVRLPRAKQRDCEVLLATLRKRLAASGDKAKSVAVVETYLAAVRRWPHMNASDLWYFFVSHAYQDRFNHPIDNAPGDLAQSWKRTSGWAFERILLDHYNPFLATHGIELVVPPRDEKQALLTPLHLTNFQTAMEKADVLAVGIGANGHDCFGVVHAKASLAERRTDDAPLSRELVSRNFVSPLVTMDCKASPSANPVNRGEFGEPQGVADRVSEKRLDIEDKHIFDAAFSFNANTVPTPSGQTAAARIYVVNFASPDDALGRHIVNKWRGRHGQPPL